MKQKQFDAAQLRQVAGCFPTGVTVVSCYTQKGEVHGMTASSFLSVSLDPALVLFSVKKENQLAQILSEGMTVGISILTDQMEAESNHFARIASMSPSPQFTDQDGAPVLAYGHAWYSTLVDALHDAGDHFLVLCQVKSLEAFPEKNPLVYYQGYKKIEAE